MPAKPNPKAAALSLLSARGVSGLKIIPHRAIHNLVFPKSRLLQVLGLPTLFTLLVWGARQPLALAWMGITEFWMERLELDTSLTLAYSGPDWVDLLLPTLEAPSPMADWTVWAWSLIGIAVVWLATGRMREAFLPLRLLLRLVCFVHFTAQVFFAIMPAAFPHSVPQYFTSMLVTGIAFMLVIPWVHALVYYILDFRLIHKLGLTALTLCFLAVAIPLQASLHVWLLLNLTILFLPLFFLVLGIPLLMLGCVALYGYAMSWRIPQEQDHLVE